MHESIVPRAGVDFAVVKLHHALSLLDAVQHLAHVALFDLVVDHLALGRHAKCEAPGEFIAIPVAEHAFAVHLAILELAGVLVTIGEVERAVAAWELSFLVKRSGVIGATPQVLQNALLHLPFVHLTDEDDTADVVGKSSGAAHLIIYPLALVVVVLGAVVWLANDFALSTLLALFKMAGIKCTIGRQTAESVGMARSEVALVVDENNFFEVVLKVNQKLAGRALRFFAGNILREVTLIFVE